MFTKEAQKLAKPCYEAIKKIAERQEKKCPECGKLIHLKKGNKEGIFVAPADGLYQFSSTPCPKCDGAGTVAGKWEWEPKWRDLIVTPTGIWMFDYEQEDDLWIRNSQREKSYIGKDDIGRIAFPLLHWERIEEILEGMGYYVRVLRNVDKDPNGNHLCECAIDRNEGHIAKVVDKTRQLAVMQAVIELGEKNNAKHRDK